MNIYRRVNTYVYLAAEVHRHQSHLKRQSNMENPFASFPRKIMAASSILFASAAYLADWSHTHVLNPRWPPHAKFHNGQTMSIGAMNAALVVYLLSRRANSSETEKSLVFVAAVVGSSTALAGLSAILYPGTAWTDPEFDTGALIAPQAYVFVGHLMFTWAGYMLEMSKLNRKHEKM
jgi:hypothetical protein